MKAEAAGGELAHSHGHHGPMGYIGISTMMLYVEKSCSGNPKMGPPRDCITHVAVWLVGPLAAEIPRPPTVPTDAMRMRMQEPGSRCSHARMHARVGKPRAWWARAPTAGAANVGNRKGMMQTERIFSNFSRTSSHPEESIYPGYLSLADINIS